MKIKKRTYTNPKTNKLYLWWGMKQVQFGKIGINVRIDKKIFFSNAKNIYIGDDVFIAQQTYFEAASKIYIGNGVMIGPRCMFVAGTHRFEGMELRAIPYDNVIKNRPIIIEDNVWIAANVIISPGTHIGEGSIIGAGANVYGDIEPFSVITSMGYNIVGQRDKVQYQCLKKDSQIYGKKYAGKGFEVLD